MFINLIRISCASMKAENVLLRAKQAQAAKPPALAQRAPSDV